MTILTFAKIQTFIQKEYNYCNIYQLINWLHDLHPKP